MIGEATLEEDGDEASDSEPDAVADVFVVVAPGVRSLCSWMIALDVTPRSNNPLEVEFDWFVEDEPNTKLASECGCCTIPNTLDRLGGNAAAGAARRC